MEDQLWFLTQKLRELKEYRADNRVVWDDEAAHELGGRFLNPLESDAEEMLKELNQQMNLLEQVNKKLEQLAELARKVEKSSKEMGQYLQEADEMVLYTYKHLDLFVQHNTEALEQMPKIYQLIAQANKAC